MKRTAMILSSLAILAASPTLAKTSETVECFISVDGEEWLNGPCILENTDGVVLTFRTDTPAMFIVGLKSKKAVFMGQSDPNDSQSLRYEGFGTVTPLDACWINERVRICAWPMGKP